MPSKTSLTGVAGAHYVLSELLRRGYIAALGPTGVPNADIVVTNMEGSRLCSIQVKSRRGVGADRGWHMSQKHEGPLGDRHFYCFVDFREPQKVRPLVYVMPAAAVAKVLAEAHQKWLSTPGHKGQSRKDGPMRRLFPDYFKTWASDNPYPVGWMEPYRDAWHLLDLERSIQSNQSATARQRTKRVPRPRPQAAPQGVALPARDGSAPSRYILRPA
jgi:hypothetical protein